MTWVRVTKQFPCGICKRPDWCTYCPDSKSWCCMRVHSARPAKNGGFWHSLGEKPTFIPRPAPAAPEIDAGALMQRFRSNTRPEHLDRLSRNLGVSTDSLTRTGCAWAGCHNAFAFPMFNSAGHVVGIRLRNDRGEKWAVRGGHEGLFIPDYLVSRLTNGHLKWESCSG
jgi:hypothetical protein